MSLWLRSSDSTLACAACAASFPGLSLRSSLQRMTCLYVAIVRSSCVSVFNIYGVDRMFLNITNPNKSRMNL